MTGVHDITLVCNVDPRAGYYKVRKLCITFQDMQQLNVIHHRVGHPIELATQCTPSRLHPRYLNNTSSKFDEK
jgi:hypothetical protein